MRGHDLSDRIGRLFAAIAAIPSNIYYQGGTDVALADGGTGASLSDPNADRVMFWDDSAGAVTWLTVGTGLSITDTTIATTGGLTTDSQQPTSDSTTVTSTGFNGCKVVQVWFAFSHTTTSLATYTLEARVSAGTWRTIATFDSLTGDNTSAVGGHLSICNFNQAAEKMANIDFYVGGTILDDSSATTTVNSGVGAAHTPKFAFLAWPEVWDEIRITSSVASSIEGSTADQRGRWYVAGQA